MAKILVVDDDIQFLGYLKVILENAGYSVETAANGEEGLRVLKQEDFDLLITDIVMPVVDGISFLDEIMNERIDLKVICISGGGERIQARDALLFAYDFGAVKTLTKPFTKTDLLPVVQEVLLG